MPDFLLEIGCEEIPARMIPAASEELRKRVQDLLAREHLVSNGSVASFDTPRRLAVVAPGISAAQPDVTERVTGPAVSAAFKDGQPTAAAHAFAKKAGTDVSRLERVTTAKGEYLSAQVTKKGRSAAEILAQLLPKELSAIYWPKNMYWRRPSERFVRPVRWLVAMLDDQVVPLEFDGAIAGDQSRGHRLLASGLIRIPSAGKSYVQALERAKVLGRDARETQIRKQLDAATRTITGARWREDKGLLDTVVNLTEFPSVILGSFDPEFLSLPEEVLVTVMRDHQKYFAVEDAQGKLGPHFLALLNTDGDPKNIIRHGHERVLRARFNDARFFWQADQKHSLRERLEMLRHVTFQKDLGTYHEKTLRVQRLASWLSEVLRQNGIAIRPGVVHKAACLSKTDLTTELVKEFTELQGIVGGLYARVQQLDEGLPETTRFAIADAIYDHYKPESAEDNLPRTLEGAMLSLGDKADSIAGMFALGMQPTGSKDPFALRRQANGIIRIIAEYKLPLPITQLFADALNVYRGSEAEKRFSTKVDYSKAISDFFRERVEFYLRDTLGFKYDVVNAVLAADADNVVDAKARAEAISKIRESSDFVPIFVAFRRLKGILQQAAQRKILVGEFVPQFSEPTEIQVWNSLQETGAGFQSLIRDRKYDEALEVAARLKPSIDMYFDKVMVMVDNPEVRQNRLALVKSLIDVFSQIADFSEIVTEGKG